MTVELTDELVEQEHYAMAGQEHRDVISRLYEGLRLWWRDRTDRLVMAEVDLYPPSSPVKMIPDLVAVVGPPQATRPAYRVGVDGPAPSVAIEVVSPSETDDARQRKLARYAEVPVPEVWFLHLHPPVAVRYVNTGSGWRAATAEVCDALDGVRFTDDDGTLGLWLPDGSAMPESTSAVAAQLSHLAARAQTAEHRAERLAVQAQAEAERAERLAAQLRSLGVVPGS